VKRREFIAGLGGAVSWPMTARAQKSVLPVIGYLSPYSPDRSTERLDAFRQGLSETGFVEGRNVVIEYRSAEGRFDRLPALAAELVRSHVTVIAALGGFDSAWAAKDATTAIPIIFVIGNDPVRTGLVASLNGPGGNITGVTLLSREIQGKRLAIARELLPDTSIIATFTNPTSVISDFNLRDLEAAAASAKLRLLTIRTSGSDAELEKAFDEVVQQGARALFINGDPSFFNRRDLIVALAARNRIPTIFPNRQYIEAGGLISYGASLAAVYRQAGTYAGRILKGEKPTDLPILQPTKFDLIINLNTAKALGLTIPETLLATADEVIQ
jgi:putative ABC transport system substrate-binding protein